MKKYTWTAIFALCLAGCYTPLNNSGVATTKPWLEIAGIKTDFNGKQYDSCYQFNLYFWPQEAAEALDLKSACISACCWRSDREEVVLDFNKNFKQNLALYGRARKYSPGKITLKISHANWLNTTRVTVSPQGAVSNQGLVKLAYQEYEDPARLAQLQQASVMQNSAVSLPQNQHTTAAKASKKMPKKPQTSPSAAKQQLAEELFKQQVTPKVDTFFYEMNKMYQRQQALFLLSSRIIQASPTKTDGVYTVSCSAKARTGLEVSKLNAFTVPCGTWQVNVAQKTVLPLDKRAVLIWNM